MKKFIYLIIVIAAFSACKTKSNLESNKELITLGDSSYKGSYLTDTGAVANPDAYINAGGVVSGKATVPDAPVAASPRRKTSTSGSGSSTARSSGTSQSSGTTASTQKKGMSKAAQGAIIGGVGGAVAGAVIGKSGKGAVIGGAVGAAGGYIIGRSKDKKSGRVQ